MGNIVCGFAKEYLLSGLLSQASNVFSLAYCNSRSSSRSSGSGGGVVGSECFHCCKYVAIFCIQCI